MPRIVRHPLPVVVVCLLVIAVLGAVVRGQNAITDLDRRVVADLASGRGATVVDVARAWTALGDGLVLAVLLLIAGAALTATRLLRPAAAFAPVVSLGAGAALAPLMKAVVERPRPPVALHEVVERSSGFPSGHSAQSAAGWLALGLVLAYAGVGRPPEDASGPRRTTGWLEARRWPLVAAAVVVLLVGASRVVLSVHSPTDVLAGWLLGLACAVTAVGLLVRGPAGGPATVPTAATGGVDEPLPARGGRRS
ncbi:phosphatase PAP2 family protein [Patulibacter sp.]|uniref:phosphatase PAP2 family protein n=1 Tax=Patulibacter sp. TaxID=1912859 RepID=UPI00271C43B4|nr:phosphatase PAP2 family protein [Patulibacter sp.]MDO9408033.1 phosphatase PAP2 family protein [Patulibacter sp.]